MSTIKWNKIWGLRIELKRSSYGFNHPAVFMEVRWKHNLLQEFWSSRWKKSESYFLQVYDSSVAWQVALARFTTSNPFQTVPAGIHVPPWGWGSSAILGSLLHPGVCYSWMIPSSIRFFRTALCTIDPHENVWQLGFAFSFLMPHCLEQNSIRNEKSRLQYVIICIQIKTENFLLQVVTFFA